MIEGIPPSCRCLETSMRWEHLRRGYNWAMTHHRKKLLRVHADVLFDDCERKFDIDLDALFKVTDMRSFDEMYSRRAAGYTSVDQYLEAESCTKYLPNVSESANVHLVVFIYVAAV